MSRQSVAEMWDDFSSKSIAQGAGELQLSEMKLAFYAGAFSLFTATFQMDPGDEPTMADLTQMDALYDEINVFLTSQIGELLPTAGRA